MYSIFNTMINHGIAPQRQSSLIEIETAQEELKCIQLPLSSEIQTQVYQTINRLISTCLSCKDIEWGNKCIVCRDPDQYLDDQILSIIFNDINVASLGQKLIDLQQKAGLGKTGVCGRILRQSDIGFKCYDCEQDPSCIICKDCFANGNHKNHRYVLQQGCQGICDCGDPEAWSVAGFCIQHKGFEDYSEEQISSVIGVDLVYRIKETFESLLYYIFQITENLLSSCLINKSARDSKSYEQRLVSYKENGNLNILFYRIFFKIKAFTAKTPMLQRLFSQVLMNRVSQIQNMHLLHNCNDLESLSLRAINKEVNRFNICNCTFLELLFRYNLMQSNQNIKLLMEFIISLFNFYDFKKELVITYVKMLNFLFTIDYSIMQFDKTSKFLELEVQLLTSDELTYYLFKEHLNNTYPIFDILQKVIVGIVQKQNASTFNNIFKHLNNITEKPLCLSIFVENDNLFDRLLNIVEILQNFCIIKDGKTQIKNLQFFSDLINIENQMLNVFYKIVSFAAIYTEYSKCGKIKPLYTQQEILIRILKKVLNKISVQPQTEQNKCTFMIILNRIFCMVLDKIFDFNNLQQSTKLQKQAELDGILNSVGITKIEFKNLLFQNIHAAFECQRFIKQIQLNQYDYTQKEQIQALPNLYKKPELHYQNLDSYLIQMCLMISMIEGYEVKQIFNYMFSAHVNIMELKKSGQPFHQLLMYGTFINLMLNILNDETSVFNVKLKSLSTVILQCFAEFKEANQLQQYCTMQNTKLQSRFINPVLSTLQKFSSFTIKDVKRELEGSIWVKDTQMDKILSHIADFDKSSKRFSLKKAYQDQYINAYNNYFDQPREHEFHQSLLEKHSKEQYMVFKNLGIKSQTIVTPPMLRFLKIYIITPDLCDMIMNYLGSKQFESYITSKPNEVNKILTSFYLATLRYIMEAISVVEDEFFKYTDVVQFILQIPQDQVKDMGIEFLIKLQMLLQQQQQCLMMYKLDDDELEYCYKVVSERLQRITTIYHITNQNQIHQDFPQQNKQENKQAQVSKKREEIMKKFQSKQKIFEQKNQNYNDDPILSATDIIRTSLQPKIDIPVNILQSCIYCKQKLVDQQDDISKSYGYCAYASYNNIHEYIKYWHQYRVVQEVQEIGPSIKYYQLLQDQQKNLLLSIKSKAGALQIDSCNHPIHYYCLTQILNNAQKQYLQDGEFQCPLCNCLSNIFVPKICSSKLQKSYQQFDSLQDCNQDLKEYYLKSNQTPQNTNLIQEFLDRISILNILNEVLIVYMGQNNKDSIIDTQYSIIQQICNIVDLYEEDMGRKYIMLSNLCKIYSQGIKLLNAKQLQEDNYQFIQKMINIRFHLEQQPQEKVLQSIEEVKEESQQQQIVSSPQKIMEDKIKSQIEQEEEWVSEESSESSGSYEEDNYDDLNLDVFLVEESSDQFGSQVIQEIQAAKQIEYDEDYSLNSNPHINYDVELCLMKGCLILLTQFQDCDSATILLQQLVTHSIIAKTIQMLISYNLKQDLNSYVAYFTNKNNHVIDIQQKDILDTIFNESQDNTIQDNITQMLRKVYFLCSLMIDSQPQTTLSLTELLEYFAITNQNIIQILQVSPLKLIQKEKISYKRLIQSNKIQIDENLFIPLFSNWAEMTKKHHSSKCGLCKDHPTSGGKLIVCLVCNEILCSSVCQGQSKNQCGNLNQHSLKVHQGQSVFLSLNDSQLYVVKSPLNHLYPAVYVNEFGEEFRRKSQKWNEFELDKEALQKVYRMIVQGSLAQDIVYKILKDKQHYRMMAL